MPSLAASIAGGLGFVLFLCALCGPAAYSLSEFLNRPETGTDYECLPATWPLEGES